MNTEQPLSVAQNYFLLSVLQGFQSHRLQNARKLKPQIKNLMFRRTDGKKKKLDALVRCMKIFLVQTTNKFFFKIFLKNLKSFENLHSNDNTFLIFQLFSSFCCSWDGQQEFFFQDSSPH
jgi:hypothetical protein